MIFIDNLEYIHAVTCICQTLDQEWNDVDDHIPDMIPMKTLLSTIMQYLHDHLTVPASSYPPLCYMSGGSCGNSKPHVGDDTHKSLPRTTHKFAEMYCNTCGQWVMHPTAVTNTDH